MQSKKAADARALLRIVVTLQFGPGASDTITFDFEEKTGASGSFSIPSRLARRIIGRYRQLEVRPALGKDVSQCSFGNLACKAGNVTCPIAEARSEAVNCCIFDFLVASLTGKHHNPCLELG
jgi:hypothetical protein